MNVVEIEPRQTIRGDVVAIGVPEVELRERGSGFEHRAALIDICTWASWVIWPSESVTRTASVTPFEVLRRAIMRPLSRRFSISAGLRAARGAATFCPVGAARATEDATKSRVSATVPTRFGLCGV